jgi:glutamine synthetase type III
MPVKFSKRWTKKQIIDRANNVIDELCDTLSTESNRCTDAENELARVVKHHSGVVDQLLAELRGAREKLSDEKEETAVVRDRLAKREHEVWVLRDLLVTLYNDRER